MNDNDNDDDDDDDNENDNDDDNDDDDGNDDDEDHDNGDSCGFAVLVLAVTIKTVLSEFPIHQNSLVVIFYVLFNSHWDSWLFLNNECWVQEGPKYIYQFLAIDQHKVQQIVKC